MNNREQKVRESGDEYAVEALKHMTAYLKSPNSAREKTARVASQGFAVVTRRLSAINSEKDLAFRMSRDRGHGRGISK